MDKVGVLEVGDLELGKHATAQLREYFEDIDKQEVKRATEIPYKLNEVLADAKGVIVLIDATDEKYMDQVVDKILDVEMKRDKPVQKLFVEKADESQETFQRRAQEAARENSEKLADKIKNLRENK
ncbi:MAG: hypothetical protein ABEK04_03730 [Candidatus Nanohalobium sp.]